jgi:hypothetical protein
MVFHANVESRVGKMLHGNGERNPDSSDKALQTGRLVRQKRSFSLRKIS